MVHGVEISSVLYHDVLVNVVQNPPVFSLHQRHGDQVQWHVEIIRLELVAHLTKCLEGVNCVNQSEFRIYNVNQSEDSLPAVCTPSEPVRSRMPPWVY